MSEIIWKLEHDPRHGYDIALSQHMARLRLTPAGGWRMSGWATEAEARKEAAAQLRALADRIEADELPVAEGSDE